MLTWEESLSKGILLLKACVYKFRSSCAKTQPF